MVVPIVVIGDVQSLGSAFAQAQQIAFARIPKMIVRKGHIGRTLAIQGAIPFGLVGITARMTVKKVAMMDPNILVILLQTDVIPFAAVAIHGGKVADFYVAGIFDSNAPTIGDGIPSDTFECNVTGRIVVVFNDHITVQQIRRIGDLSDKSYAQRAQVLSLFIAIQDRLNSDTGIGIGSGYIQ